MPNVPNTNTFTLQDVYNSVSGHAGGTSSNLSSCFSNSVDAYFDVTYKGSKDRMSNFKNYTPSACPAIGSVYNGGKVAYLYQPGDPGYISGECHGIISSISDQSASIQWYNGTNINITGASYSDLGRGSSNTSAIKIAQGAVYTNYAAGLAAAVSDGGYTDWCLPSSTELSKMYINRSAIGGFFESGNFYWSSTNVNLDYARSFSFTSGSSILTEKFVLGRVRAIRYF